MARAQNVGFRVFAAIERPPREVVAAYEGMETVYLSDAMNRFGGMAGNIRPAEPTMRLFGPAVTVRVPPGDNLMVYKAFAVAQPGDVLVIETRGCTSVAEWGDLASAAAKGLGLAGVVTDGVLRDLAGIRAVGLPVFAQPIVVPDGARRNGPGEVNVPVAVGGVPVLPGDMIVGDESGVVVIPRADAAAVLAEARALAAGEIEKQREFAEGKLIPEGLDELLRRRGCEMVD